MRVWRRECGLGERPFYRFIGPSSPWERRKERAPPRAGCCLSGARVVFLLPPAKEGGESGRMRRIRPPPAWLGPLSPPGEGRPSFPLSPALKGRWPVRGADRWGETRGRSPPCQRGRRAPSKGNGAALVLLNGHCPRKDGFSPSAELLPLEKKKRESAPESRLLPPGGACGFSLPSRQRGDRGGGGMRHIRPPPAWLGPLSPPGEGRPGFPLFPL